MMRKTYLKLVALALVMGIGIAGDTAAFFTTSTATKNNNFIPGVLSTAIFENGVLADEGTTVISHGTQTTQKMIQVENSNHPNEIDTYIRVMLVPVFRTPEGSVAGNVSLEPSNDFILVNGPEGGTVTLNLNSSWAVNWIYSNGYFYHKAIVHPGELTQVLLDSVTVSEPGLWETFQLEVLSDAIQAENSAANAAWEVDVSSGQITMPNNGG